jgi:hypothetical protein
VPTVACYADDACADPDARCADDETPTVTVGRAYADGDVHCADGAGPSAQKVVPVVIGAISYKLRLDPDT